MATNNTTATLSHTTLTITTIVLSWAGMDGRASYLAALLGALQRLLSSPNHVWLSDATNLNDWMAAWFIQWEREHGRSPRGW